VEPVLWGSPNVLLAATLVILLDNPLIPALYQAVNMQIMRDSKGFSVLPTSGTLLNVYKSLDSSPGGGRDMSRYLDIGGCYRDESNKVR